MELGTHLPVRKFGSQRCSHDFTRYRVKSSVLGTFRNLVTIDNCVFISTLGGLFFEILWLRDLRNEPVFRFSAQVVALWIAVQSAT